MVHYPKEDDKRSIGLRELKEEKSAEDMFEILKKYDKSRAVIGASAQGAGEEEKTPDGIVNVCSPNQIKNGQCEIFFFFQGACVLYCESRG